MLAAAIRAWGRELGFGAVGIADVDLGAAEARLPEWLARGLSRRDGLYGAARRAPRAAGRAGARHAARDQRAHGLPARGADGRRRRSRTPDRAYVSRYALGRDYHKVLRARLQRLADRIAREIGAFGYRVFTDSRAGDGSRAGGARRARLARQAHAAAVARRRLVLLPRRDLHRPAAAAGSPDHGALRHLHALHRRLSRRRPSSRPTSSTRGAASPISPSS